MTGNKIIKENIDHTKKHGQTDTKSGAGCRVKKQQRAHANDIDVKPAIPADKNDTEGGMGDDFDNKENQRESHLPFTAQNKTDDKNGTTNKIKERHKFDMKIVENK